MALEITGSLIKKLPVQSGSSVRGEWQKQEFILETQDNFPKKVCMNVWGSDKVSELSSYSEGELLKVSFNVESREFNQRWYTDIRAWKIERAGNESNSAGYSPAAPVASGGPDREQVRPGDLPSDIGEDDLPF
jgi:hypothetical protein